MNEKIHHLSCATMCAALAVPGLIPSRFIGHCLLVERGDGSLVLIDTGFGSADVAEPAARLGRVFLTAVGPRMDQAQTAVAQIRALGLNPADVRDVVLTHLDADHAGGISDFPNARIHIHSEELEPARNQQGLLGKIRFSQAHWSHHPQWISHSRVTENWFGLDALPILDTDVMLIALHGHTLGHCGVAVRRPSGGWFLHAGDSYYSSREKDTPPSSPPGMRAFQIFLDMDRHARRESQRAIRELHGVHAAEITIFSAHDQSEFDALSGVTH